MTDLTRSAGIVINMEDAKAIFTEALCRYGPLDNLTVEHISMDETGDVSLELMPKPKEAA